MNTNNNDLNKKQCVCGKDKALNDLLKRISNLEFEVEDKDRENERLNNKYNKALELLIDYNLPCEADDFMNVHSDYCKTHCGVNKERYKRCWNKYIEWKIGSDK